MWRSVKETSEGIKITLLMSWLRWLDLTIPVARLLSRLLMLKSKRWLLLFLNTSFLVVSCYQTHCFNFHPRDFDRLNSSVVYFHFRSHAKPGKSHHRLFCVI